MPVYRVRIEWVHEDDTARVLPDLEARRLGLPAELVIEADCQRDVYGEIAADLGRHQDAEGRWYISLPTGQPELLAVDRN